MKTYEVIKAMYLNNNKQFKAIGKPYRLTMGRSGGINVHKSNKHYESTTVCLSAEIMELLWTEIRQPISALEALAIKDKKIKPFGNYEFYTSEEWLLNICENRDLLQLQWEVE